MNQPENKKNLVEQTIQTYNKIASHYSKLWTNDHCMEPFLEKFIQLLRPHASVVDIGCGTGRDVKYLIKRGVDAVGIDLSEEMLKEARKTAPKAEFKQMDMKNTDFEDVCFDGIWSSASIPHIPKDELPILIEEINRILKKTGILFIAVRKGSKNIVNKDGRFYAYYTETEI